MHIQTPLRSLPATAGSHVQHAIPFCAPRMKTEEAHLVESADRAAGWRESRHQYGIDHGSALLQRRRSQQQPGQDPGWPSGRFASYRIYYELWTRVPLTLGRFKLFASDQDGCSHTMCARAPIQSAWAGDVGDGRSRYMRKRARARISQAEKSFCRTRYPRSQMF